MTKTIALTSSELWLIILSFLMGGGFLGCAGVAAVNSNPVVFLFAAAFSYAWAAITIIIAWREMQHGDAEQPNN